MKHCRGPRYSSTTWPATFCQRMLSALATLCVSMVSMPIHCDTEAQGYAMDEETGIESWQVSVRGVTVSLTQILPDQLRAFYVNRGFPVDVIEPYAVSCVYMTALRNDAAAGVATFRIADWRVVAGAQARAPISTAAWVTRLQPAQPGHAAMIAFRWAQFPSEHAYQPGGDWNQGMLSTGLQPGEQFDLIASWHVDGQAIEGELKNVRCARESR